MPMNSTGEDLFSFPALAFAFPFLEAMAVFPEPRVLPPFFFSGSDAAGTSKRSPQRGQVVLVPALSSADFKLVSHLGQEKRIMIEPQCSVLGIAKNAFTLPKPQVANKWIWSGFTVLLELAVAASGLTPRDT
jgi:hypothetical protein